MVGRREQRREARVVIGIAWKVEEGESFKDAVRQAILRHKKKFGHRPDHILVNPVIAESLTVKGLTVVGSQFVGKSYTFLLYRR